MRFYEGDFAYEIERIRDTATQVYTGWRYNVYRIRPDHKLLRSGSGGTQQEAESAARRELESVMKAHENAAASDETRAA